MRCQPRLISLLFKASCCGSSSGTRVANIWGCAFHRGGTTQSGTHDPAHRLASGTISSSGSLRVLLAAEGPQQDVGARQHHCKTPELAAARAPSPADYLCRLCRARRALCQGWRRSRLAVPGAVPGWLSWAAAGSGLADASVPARLSPAVPGTSTGRGWWQLPPEVCALC